MDNAGKLSNVEEVVTAVKEKLISFAREHNLTAVTVLVPCLCKGNFDTFRVLAAVGIGNLFEFEKIPAKLTEGLPCPSLAAYSVYNQAKLHCWQQGSDENYSHFPVFGSSEYSVGAYALREPSTFVLQGMVEKDRELPKQPAWATIANNLMNDIYVFDCLDPARYGLNQLHNGDTGGVVCTDITNSYLLVHENIVQGRTADAIHAIRELVGIQEGIAEEHGGILLTSSGDGCMFLFPMREDLPNLSGSVAAIQAAKEMVVGFEGKVDGVLAQLVNIGDDNLCLEDDPNSHASHLRLLLNKIRIRIAVAAGVWLFSDSGSPLVNQTAVGTPINRAAYLNQAMKSIDSNAIWVDDFAYTRAKALNREIEEGFLQTTQEVELKSKIRTKPWEWRSKDAG